MIDDMRAYGNQWLAEDCVADATAVLAEATTLVEVA
jgi:hypothetical protein